LLRKAYKALAGPCLMFFRPEFGNSCAKKHACLLAGESASLKTTPAFHRAKLILAAGLRIGMGRNAKLKAAIAENGKQPRRQAPALKQRLRVPVLALNDERVRGDFLEWRDEIATRSPREADYYIGLLRMVIQWGWDRRKYGITINHASRPGRLHNETRIDIVWNRERALHFYGSAPAHLRFPFMFAAHSAWRQAISLPSTFPISMVPV
jgi:hypothetical protein